MDKLPYPPEFRAKVAQEYLDGLGSFPFLAEKYGIGRTTIQQWVAKYQLHGISAFVKKTGNAAYSQDFKLMCVKEVLTGEGTVDDIVAKYNISARQVLRDWIKSYNANSFFKTIW